VRRALLAAPLLAALVLAVLALGACGDDDGTAIDLACKRDSDCPEDMTCVVAAGVCVGFSNPLEAVDASRPD
jgi:hypothetical protein